MSELLSYHVVIHAMEARSGWTSHSRFAAAIGHVIDGHLPHERYLLAGRARKREGIGEDSIERMVKDWMMTDLNPALQILTSFRHPASVVEGFNAYNASAPIGLPTTIATPDQRLDKSQFLIQMPVDQESAILDLCIAGGIMVASVALDRLRYLPPADLSIAASRPSLVRLAELLGMSSSAAGEASQVFETEGYVPIATVAKRLGCHQRTLERRLRAMGLTAEGLRQAARLIGAVQRLNGNESLTTIAIDTGFSDLAHMTRAFKRSCGMTPSLCRSLVWNDAKRYLAENSKPEGA
jgi:AraC-like DNA-binding protein